MSDILLVEEFSKKQLPLAPFSQLNESEKLQVIEYLKEEERKLLLLVEQEGDDSEKAEKGRSELGKKVSFWAHTAVDIIDFILGFINPGAGAVLSFFHAISYVVEAQFLDRGEEIDIFGLKLDELDWLYTQAGMTFVFGAVPGMIAAKTTMIPVIKTISKTKSLPQMPKVTMQAFEYAAQHTPKIKALFQKAQKTAVQLANKSYLTRIALKKIPIDKAAESVTKGLDNLGDISERIVKAGPGGYAKIKPKVAATTTKTVTSTAKATADDIAKATAKATKEGIEAVPDTLVQASFKNTLSGLGDKGAGVLRVLKYLLVGNSKSFLGIGTKLTLHYLTLGFSSYIFFGRMLFKIARKNKTIYYIYKGDVIPAKAGGIGSYLRSFFKAKGVKNADEIVNAAEATTKEGTKQALKNVPKNIKLPKLSVAFRPIPQGIVQAAKYAPVPLLLKDMYLLMTDNNLISSDTLLIVTDDAEEVNAEMTKAPQNVINTQTDEVVVSSNRISLEKANFAHQQGFNYIYDCDKMQAEKIDKLTGKAVAVYKRNSSGWWSWTQTGALVSRSMNTEINRIAAMCVNKQSTASSSSLSTVANKIPTIQTVEPMRVPMTQDTIQIPTEPQIQAPSIEPIQLSPDQRIQQARQDRRTARQQARQDIRQARQDRRDN